MPRSRLLLIFQSTPPRGGRLPFSVATVPGMTISIHAPARGATAALKEWVDNYFISIHAPARGATISNKDLICKDCKFQSTPPRGGRRLRIRHVLAVYHFNPRPREGGDHITWEQALKLYNISIHAPARGATLDLIALKSVQKFQSTPPRGGRQQRCTVLPADL